jgi:cytochrome c peroxidase
MSLFIFSSLRLSQCAVALIALSLASCGGGNTTTSAAATTATPASLAGLSEAAYAYLNVNLNALKSYASPALPAHYDSDVLALDNTPLNNIASDKVATLGQVLFFDKRLSVNNTVACASCHQAGNGFSDKTQFSVGFSGSAFTTAHAMRLGNSRYYSPGSMFWDKRAASIEAQASQPIINAVEMGWDANAGGINALLTKLSTSAPASNYYPELFKFAFGDTAITEDRLQKALAQFERSMVSTNSKWDTAYAAVYSAAAPNKNIGVSLLNQGFTASEERGRTLFIAPPQNGGLGCVGCHTAPTFALNANSRSNGLDAGETRVFKSPSLKNVGFDSAFMHDGRFATLEAVIEHYNSGVQNGPALDNRLKDSAGNPRRLNLSASDKTALVDFLKTLNDTVLTTDAKFSSPFKQ